MPKLDGTHIVERLQRRIAELEAGEELAAKDVRALLTAKQHKAYEDVLKEQKALRAGKRARSEEEKAILGWRTTREIRLGALKGALLEAQDSEAHAWDKKKRDAEIRQGHIYFDALNKAIGDGKDLHAARIWANNELTRSGLRRIDGKAVTRLSKRDQELRQMEEALKASFANQKASK